MNTLKIFSLDLPTGYSHCCDDKLRKRLPDHGLHTSSRRTRIREVSGLNKDPLRTRLDCHGVNAQSSPFKLCHNPMSVPLGCKRFLDFLKMPLTNNMLVGSKSSATSHQASKNS